MPRRSTSVILSLLSINIVITMVSAVAIDSRNNQIASSIFTVDSTNMLPYGKLWTYSKGSFYSEPPPTVADINSDGYPEILLGSKGSGQPIFFCLNREGGEMWTFDTGGGQYACVDAWSPEVADIDNDGAPEIVVVSTDRDGDGNNRIIALNGDGTELWRHVTPGHGPTSPRIADINNDGQLEVIGGESIGAFENGRVYVLDSSGNELWDYPCGRYVNVNVADIDNDGDLEVIACSGYGDNHLYVFDGFGNVLWSSPIDSRKIPSIGDLNNDGQLEIAVGFIYLTGGGVRLFDAGGNIMWTYSTVEQVQTSPTIVDVNKEGAVIWTFLTGGAVRSPTVADLNNDGNLEIVSGNWDGYIYCISHEGTEIWTYYIMRSVERVAAADITGDQTLELLVEAKKLYTFVEGGPTQSPDVILTMKYFPIYWFSSGENWYPCSFYFDQNGDNWPSDLINKDNYDSYPSWPPPYYVYVHISENTTHKAIQYWLYYVWNYHPSVWAPEHDSDWDSTIFVILEKAVGDPVPVEICYFFHLAKERKSWSDWPEREYSGGGMHPYVYVAEGSHGAYSSPGEMIDNPKNRVGPIQVNDDWQPGGRVLGEFNCNWYLVGDSVGHAHGYSGNMYCDMTVEWIEGELQWEFDDYWWPAKFPYISISSMDSPWHRSDWTTVQPSVSKFSVSAFSPIDILITDPNGLRVGYDPYSEEIISEIPGALYSGPSEEPEVVLIPNPVYGNYTTSVIGIETGTYNLTLSRTVEDIEIYHEELNDVPILQNETQSISTLVLSHADIAVVAIEQSKTVIGQDLQMLINVTTDNHGIFTENVNVTLYANNTIIDQTEVAIESGNSTTLTFLWNTTGFAKGIYTIRATAIPVPSEADTTDNTKEGWVIVTIVGDVDGDRDVDIFDIVYMVISYGNSLGDPAYDPISDIDGDGDVDIFDIVIATGHYGESW